MKVNIKPFPSADAYEIDEIDLVISAETVAEEALLKALHQAYDTKTFMRREDVLRLDIEFRPRINRRR